MITNPLTWRTDNIILGIVLLASLYFLFGDDILDYFERVDCDELTQELIRDDLCRASDDCVFTREELGASRERIAQYDEYCK